MPLFGRVPSNVNPVTMTTVQLVKAVASTTQRITISGAGIVKGVILIRNGSETGIDGGGYGNGNRSIGFGDGTNEFCIHNMIDSEDEADGQDVNHSHSNITIARREQVAPWTALAEGYTLTALGDGFIDIQTTTNTTSGRDQWVTVIAFSGDDVLSCEVFEVDDLGTTTSPVSITGLSGEPSVIFIGAVNESTPLSSYDDINLSAQADSELSYGFAINNVSDDQGSFTMGTEQNVQPVDMTSVISNTACLCNSLNGTFHYKVTAGNWGTTGGGSFDLTPSANAGNAICGGLAVKLGADVNMAVVDTAYPTGGNYTQADVGFTPTFAHIIAMDGPTAYDTATQIDFQCDHIAAITDSEMICHVINYAHHGFDSYAGAVGTFLTTSLQLWESDTEAAASPPDLIFDNSGYSLNASGWSFTTTTNPAVETKGVALAIG